MSERKVTPRKPGKSTSKVEVLNVSRNGLWLCVKPKEYFLSYKDFPWFKDAKISQIYNVTLHHGHHLRWKDMDVDLELQSLERPDLYPLKYAL